MSIIVIVVMKVFFLTFHITVVLFTFPNKIYLSLVFGFCLINTFDMNKKYKMESEFEKT